MPYWVAWVGSAGGVVVLVGAFIRIGQLIKQLEVLVEQIGELRSSYAVLLEAFHDLRERVARIEGAVSRFLSKNARNADFEG